MGQCEMEVSRNRRVTGWLLLFCAGVRRAHIPKHELLAMIWEMLNELQEMPHSFQGNNSQ